PFAQAAPEPLPGMLPDEDIHLQLVDSPPVSAEYVDSWYANALQPADAALLVVDLSDPACADLVQAVLEKLDERRVSLVPEWPAAANAAELLDDDNDARALDPFRLRLPTLLVANKLDVGFDPADPEVLQALT